MNPLEQNQPEPCSSAEDNSAEDNSAEDNSAEDNSAEARSEKNRSAEALTQTADPELNHLLTELNDLQAELHYRQAQDVLHDLVERLDLSARERAGLEPELHQLETLLDKLDRQVIQIAVFGMVGRGKSSLLNALLGQEIFETGPTHGVTRAVQSASWQVTQEAIQGSSESLVRVVLPGLGDSSIEVIDTPGIDEVDGEVREAMARQLARQADLILFVVAGDITKVEFEALSDLRQASKPMLLVFNKIDQYPPANSATGSGGLLCIFKEKRRW